MRCVLYAVGLALVASACSNDSTGPVDGPPPPVPQNLVSTSLDRGIALVWDDNAFTTDPARFQNYRVFSTDFDLDGNACATDWRLEGTTVAPEFLVGALANGVPRCFAVSAVTTDQQESGRSAARNDTPRPDARNVVLYARQAQDAGSGFIFWADDGDGRVQDDELGVVTNGSNPVADFSVERDLSGALYLTPVFASTAVALYGNVPVADLTSIDYAPVSGYDRPGLEAVPGWGYVLEMAGPDGFARYGAVRVTHVGVNLLILDWAYQTDPGNPELRVSAVPR
ncbi:MAG TPA: hypothetical protein VFU46_13260 [Gemmatimonadales bacterium]|nr:hypothetical protein [Gemmatimonadales bacterium]